MLRKGVWLATLIAVSVLVIGASSGVVVIGGTEKTLIIALCDEPAGINWMDAQGDIPSDNVVLNLNDCLMRINYDTATLDPELALEWWQEDELTWVVKLREGVQFHKGYGEMAAEDVAFGANRIIQDSLHLAFLFSGLDYWEPVDKYTARVHLTEPFAPFMLTTCQGVGGCVVSKKAYEALGLDRINREPVGTGPFEIVEWVPADHITLQRFEDYWDEGYPLVDKVIFKFIPDPTVRQELLRAGEVHIIDHPQFKDVAKLQADPDLMVQSIPGWNWDYITVGHQEGPFGDKRVRQAISYAIDRQEIADAVYYGQATPGEKPLPPGFLYENPTISMYPVKPDLEKARSLLAEAGYPEGFKAKAITSGKANLRRELEIVAYQLKKIGIDLELQFLDNATYSEKSHQTGGYDIALEDITIMSADPDSAIRWFWHTGAALAHGYSNPTIDALIDAGTLESNPLIRGLIYEELQRQMLNEALFIYTVHVNQIRVMRKEVTGFQITPCDSDFGLKYVDLAE